MKVFSVYNPSNVMESIGVMIEDYVKFDEAYDRRRVINTMGVEVPLVSIDDLIKLKEHAGRGRDKIDLDALKEIKNGNEIK
jgi:predicted nucleotidyltransferase